jgi:hypothetical protein
MKFALVWRRQIHHRHLVAFFQLLAALLLAIVVAGCFSSEASIESLYLVELKYDSSGAPPLTAPGVVNRDAYNVLNAYVADSDVAVRIGYFGICANSSLIVPKVVQMAGTASPPGANATTGWQCSTNITLLTTNYKLATQDPLNLIYVGNQLRMRCFSPWVLLVAIILSVISLVIIILIDTTQTVAFPLMVCSAVLAFLFSLLGMSWQQSSVDSIAVLTNNLLDSAVKATTGTSASGLGWSATIFLFGCSVGLVVLYLNDRRRYGDSGSDVEVKGGSSTSVIGTVAEGLEKKIEELNEKLARSSTRGSLKAKHHSRSGSRDHSPLRAASHQSAHSKHTVYNMPGTMSMPVPY